MDFGSLDFATWRLVGLGLLALGAIAAVVAIVAIILTFRGGSTDDYRGVAAAPRRRDDDDDDDADDDRDDDDDFDDDDDDDEEPDRDVHRDRDGGPTALPVGLSTPTESLFTVPADTPARPPLRSTRDEPHVPSPDWYDYADVDVAPASTDRDDHDRDDAVRTASAASREADPPAASPPAAAPPNPAEQPSDPGDRRQGSRWFDEPASNTSAADVSPSFLARYSDNPSAPAAGAPVIFPWERRAETTKSAQERSDAPTPQEPRRPLAERRAERMDAGSTEAIPAVPAVPTVTPPRDVTPQAAPEPPEPQEPQRPTAQRHAEREDTGTAAVPSAPSAPAAARPVERKLPVRQDPDAPEADWYDDPDGSGGERWWDGKSWTRHRRPRSAAPMTTDTGRQRAIARQQAAPQAAAGRRRSSSESDADEYSGGTMSSRPPGWYRDPSGAGGRRFWDGSRWTDDA